MQGISSRKAELPRDERIRWTGQGCKLLSIGAGTPPEPRPSSFDSRRGICPLSPLFTFIQSHLLRTILTMSTTAPKTPVLLLKTKSVPGDAYEELLSSSANGVYEPSFVPVLEHRFDDAGMAKVRGILQNRSIGTAEGCAYGGLIFTSQRAVEAFTRLVEEGRGETPVSAGWDQDGWLR